PPKVQTEKKASHLPPMAAPPPVLTLAVEKGPREGETRRCRAGAALRVGRVVSGNDLAVRDVGASQRHLTIEFLPPPASRWAVSDLGSSNGTFINGARLLPSVPAPLSHGDLIILGQSTVLAVSIAPDSDVKPGPRRSSRRAAAVAVVEEKPTPSVTRLSTRKMVGKRAAAAALEPSETEKGGPDAAAVVVEEESHRVVTRGGGRKKVAGAESVEAGKEEMEEAAVATLCDRRKAVEPPELENADERKEEKAAVATRGRKRKKAVEFPELEKADEQKEVNAAVATCGRKRKNSVEFPELETVDEQKEEKAAVATRGWKRKKAESSEPEKGDEGKEEAVVVTCREGREVATTVAPPPLPPKPTSRRVQGRVTRARARKAVLEEEEEVAAPREKEKSEVAAGDEEVEGTANALEEVPVAQRGLARRVPKEMTDTECVASDNRGKEINEGGGEEENGKMEAVNSGGELEDDEKGEKHTGRSSLDTITLQEWFERMERYVPWTINEAADEMIATLEEKHRRINEYISVLGNSCNPSRDSCIVRNDGQSTAG
uniref:FHA domain-containing protein n=1 Tax=Aegilops tauschii subsp. strangulata TaxID=200361 RepID=A0A453RLV4_AEGTS